jgi:hypothetical protein
MTGRPIPKGGGRIDGSDAHSGVPNRTGIGSILRLATFPIVASAAPQS